MEWEDQVKIQVTFGIKEAKARVIDGNGDVVASVKVCQDPD